MILGEYNNISLLNLYNPSARIVKVEEFDFLLEKKKFFNRVENKSRYKEEYPPLRPFYLFIQRIMKRV